MGLVAAYIFGVFSGALLTLWIVKKGWTRYRLPGGQSK